MLGTSRIVFVLLLVLACMALAIWSAHHLGWTTLATNQDAAMRWKAVHPIAAVTVYLTAYVLTAALSLPNAAILSVAGGLFFGSVVGCLLTICGATAGATLLVLLARSALGDTLARRGGPMVTSVRARLQRDGFSYLLALRLVPLVPFWVVNLAAAVGGIRLRAFVPATALGIMPASFVLSLIGSGLGGVLAEGRTPDLSLLFAPRLILPLIGLALLSLLPVVMRRRSGANA